jgi:hypothetical protein
VDVFNVEDPDGLSGLEAGLGANERSE